MNVTYIHHSGFLVETDRFYYLFDYEKGPLPEMNTAKPIFVLSSHSHADHYNPEIFHLLENAGMGCIRAVLSDDIEPPANVKTTPVSPGKVYTPEDRLKITAFRSTDLGVAFLIEEGDRLIYHAGDLNDWVWEEESDAWNEEMTDSYRKQIHLLSETLGHQSLDLAFVVLDPRQEKDYDRGMCFFLEHIPAKQVWPMHYWENKGIIDEFLREHPQYRSQIQKTE